MKRGERERERNVEEKGEGRKIERGDQRERVRGRGREMRLSFCPHIESLGFI